MKATNDPEYTKQITDYISNKLNSAIDILAYNKDKKQNFITEAVFFNEVVMESLLDKLLKNNISASEIPFLFPGLS